MKITKSDGTGRLLPAVAQSTLANLPDMIACEANERYAAALSENLISTLTKAVEQYEDAAQTLRMCGARTHFLRNVDVDLPLGALVVVTGVSGSGKSSLLIDTIAAEGHRRVWESLSRSADRSLPLPPAPDVDRIDGLPPVVALRQHPGSISSRSSLADASDLSSALRTLFAKLGTAHCPRCGQPVARQSVDEMVSQIMRLEERKKVLILAPVVRGETGAQKDRLAQLESSGFVRVRIDGEMHESASPPKLAPRKPHDIEIVIDRIIVKPGIEDRLRESVRLALREANEMCMLSEESEGGWIDRLYSTKYACAKCDLNFPPLEPRSFNPSSPHGACATCQGTGSQENGDSCPECLGEQLNEFSRHIRYRGETFPGVLRRSIDETSRFFDHNSSETASAIHGKIADVVLPEIRERLRCLRELGLGYLTLDRTATTLSGGELQRVQLAAALAGGLSGVCYLLDEPTSGLHAVDSERLLHTLRNLRDRGNSVMVIEHDLVICRGADWIVEFGPGAGRDGGEIVSTGTPDELRRRAVTPTEQVLAQGWTAATKGDFTGTEFLEIDGICCRNFHDAACRFPLQSLVCVSGVSGSGKSTLVEEVISATLRRRLDGEPSATVNCREMCGDGKLTAVRRVDQSPLGRSGRSNPATVTGVWDEIRRILAGTRTARLRGYPASRFSFLSSAGRCDRCRGKGEIVHRLAVLPETRTPCPYCRGKRFNAQTLSIEFKGRNAADILDMTVAQAAEFFASFPVVRQKLNTLVEMGLGYLPLGQPAPTLSGGESQRIRLAAELGKWNLGPTLYLLDEPTQGLHQHDIGTLLSLLRKMIAEGHSVLMIEHQLGVLAASDWIIDLGPGAGEEGGKVVAQGTPQDIISEPASITGSVLREFIDAKR